MPPATTVVFDLDGTLAETAPDIIATLNRLLAREGMEAFPLERARDLVGAGSRALIQRSFALQKRPLGEAQLEALFTDFMQLYSDHLADHSYLFPGAVAALERLSQAGYRLAICTNKMQVHTDALLEKLGVASAFHAICGRDAFDFCKPDPRHIIQTVARAGGVPERAVMIGDSITDIAAAKSARIPVVAVPFGYSDSPIASLNPDRLIAHFDELDTVLIESLIG